jgi:asparagine synthase (glutamine-hydrolysing)
MCGILGIIAPRGRSISVGRERVVAMRDSMTARGPDDAGLLMRGNVALAHRRLAIRDLSAGSQPIVSEDGQTAIVYNGELYNDRELRTELQQLGVKFQTRCDTETLLAAWTMWGVDCLQKLQGMFAFGVYDFAENRLYLVRDRFGVKPLFFAEAAGELVFASTVAAVLQHPHVLRQPNWSTISHYLTTFRTTMGRETMFRGVRQLRPAECLEWNLHTGDLQIARYWNFPTKTTADITFDEAANELESLLADSTQSRLVSDVPVGMFLSGGVDSSMLASFVSQSHDSRLLGSCGGGQDASAETGQDNDFSAAANCARHTGFEFDEVRVSPETYLDCWSELVGDTALPLTTPSDVIIHQLARRMKQDVGVVLGGEGADELLCGYALPHWSIEDFRLARLCAAGQWPGRPSGERAFLKSLEATYGRCQFNSLVDHYFAANSLIPLAVKPRLLTEDAWNAAGHDEAMASFYQNEFATDSDPHREDAASLVHSQSVVLHRLNLESLLGRLDTATMQASLEARVPYTDHRLVEFAFGLPSHFRIDVDPHEATPYLAAAELDRRRTLRPKRLLRAVASRSLPPELAQRRKASFPTPVASWLSGPWQAWAQSRLLNSPFGRQAFRRETMAELASNVSAAGMWLWPILNLLAWGDSVFA